MPLGLYISVPFCRTKCSYCNFASDVFSKSAYENYVARLLEDIVNSRPLAAQLGCMFEETADSIYLGGGTPSILDPSQLLRIFAAVRGQFAVTPDAEITVECAPGTLTPVLVETLLQCGVNRVSLGVQSFVDREAQSVGRLHKRSTVLDEIRRLRKAGLANINIDLIAGLPHQTGESWAFSVSETIATAVPHVSVYMLEVDDDSRLGRELIAGGARYHAHFVPDDDATADFYEQACQMLASAGIAQYEISNFARVETRVPRPSSAWAGVLQNNESRHNLKYWTRQPYLGFGVDAHSFLPLVWGRAPSPVQAERTGAPVKPGVGLTGWSSSAAARGPSNSGFALAVEGVEAGRHQALRFATPDSLDAYMNRAPHAVTRVSAQAAIEESFFLGLRLNRGIDLTEIGFREGHDRGPQQARFSPAGVGDFSRAANTTGRSAALAAEASCWQSAQSAIQQCLREGLLEQQGTILRLTGRGRLLSNEVFARFLIEEKAGTDHVNPR
jgi:oxygen-independent coproporphyrinogen III oxidase